MARGTFGERLKRERELREVTLEEITSATRIGSRFLEALENEDWEKLPGGVFNRGFVRSIARYLGLDEEALLGEYDLAHGAQVSPKENAEQKIASPPRWKTAATILVVLVILAVLVAACVFTWRRFVARHAVKPASAAAAPAPSASPPATIATTTSLPLTLTSTSVSPANSETPPKSVSGPLNLLVSTSAPTHLLVLADGRVAFYDEVHAGENLHFSAEQNFEVTTADSGAVLLELNGQTMPPLGVPGSSGTIKLSHDDLRQASGGDSKP